MNDDKVDGDVDGAWKPDAATRVVLLHARRVEVEWHLTPPPRL